MDQNTQIIVQNEYLKTHTHFLFSSPMRWKILKSVSYSNRTAMYTLKVFKVILPVLVIQLLYIITAGKGKWIEKCVYSAYLSDNRTLPHWVEAVQQPRPL